MMNEPVVIIVSGTLPSYERTLGPFLDTLPEYFHIYISCPKYSEDQYLNKDTNVRKLLKIHVSN